MFLVFRTLAATQTDARQFLSYLVYLIVPQYQSHIRSLIKKLDLENDQRVTEYMTEILDYV